MSFISLRDSLVYIYILLCRFKTCITILSPYNRSPFWHKVCFINKALSLSYFYVFKGIVQVLNHIALINNIKNIDHRKTDRWMQFSWTSIKSTPRAFNNWKQCWNELARDGRHRPINFATREIWCERTTESGASVSSFFLFFFGKKRLETSN